MTEKNIHKEVNVTNPGSSDSNISNEKIDFMNVDETDFESMSLGEKIRHLEVEGYTVLPKAVDASKIEQIKKEMKDAPMQTKDYSDCQTFHLEPQWYSPAVASLIANPPVVEFLEELCGPEIIFTRGFFHRTLPGSPPVSMHTDGQPFGSSIFGYEGSSPKLLRVIYYFDDLTKERAPFRILPRSHLSFHAEANPYKRYKSHPEEITICAEAGTAIVFPVNIFHGVHPNLADTRRTMVQFGYRPIWAGPIKPMEEWDPELVEKAPKETKRFLKKVSTVQELNGNSPTNLKE